MPLPILVTAGDDITIPLPPLYENGAAAVLTGATIYAAIQDGCGGQLVAPALQSSSSAGADWPNGIVVAKFARATTGNLQPIDAWLEIQATRSGEVKTFELIPLRIQLGCIP